MADPRLVEGRPVALQVPHEDADPYDIRQVGAGRSEDGGQVSEDLVRLLGCLSRPPASLRIGSEQRRDKNPAARFHRLGHWAGVPGRVRRLDYLHQVSGLSGGAKMTRTARSSVILRKWWSRPRSTEMTSPGPTSMVSPSTSSCARPCCAPFSRWDLQGQVRPYS